MLFKGILLTSALLTILVGWYQLIHFASTPGAQAAAPSRLPAAWLLAQAGLRDGDSPLLMVFIHPQCSCTHATLDELDQILETHRSPLQVALVVYGSKVLDRRMDDGAGKLGGIISFEPGRQLHHRFQVVPDRNGTLARRFGAATSGEIILYAADGRLLFQGGITPERSHVGDSSGGEALRAALTTGATQSKTSNVFGCPIFSLGQTH